MAGGRSAQFEASSGPIPADLNGNPAQPAEPQMAGRYGGWYEGTKKAIFQMENKPLEPFLGTMNFW